MRNLINRIRKFFGLRTIYQWPQRTEVTVLADMLDRMDEVAPPSKSERARIMELDPAEIAEHVKQNLKEEFEALPFSRISDGAREAIIRIVRADVANQTISHVDVLRKKTAEALNRNIQ